MNIKTIEKPQLGEQKGALSDAINAAGLLSKALQKVQYSGIQVDPDGIVAGVHDDMKNRLIEIDGELDARKIFASSFGSAYARRCGVLGDRKQLFEAKLKNGTSTVENKRKTIVGTGVSESEAIRLVPDFNGSDIQAEIDEITDELIAWSRFHRTGLAADLPENAMYLRDNPPVWLRK